MLLAVHAAADDAGLFGGQAKPVQAGTGKTVSDAQSKRKSRRKPTKPAAASRRKVRAVQPLQDPKT